MPNRNLPTGHTINTVAVRNGDRYKGESSLLAGLMRCIMQCPLVHAIRSAKKCRAKAANNERWHWASIEPPCNGDADQSRPLHQHWVHEGHIHTTKHSLQVSNVPECCRHSYRNRTIRPWGMLTGLKQWAMNHTRPVCVRLLDMNLKVSWSVFKEPSYVPIGTLLEDFWPSSATT